MGENNENLQDDEIVIDLMDLFQLLLRKIHIIIGAGVICAFIALLWTKCMITPMYDSVTKAYVLTKQDANTLTYSDIQTGTQLTKDYVELAKSRPVLEEAIYQLDLGVTVEQLAKNITVETPADTRILKITVRNADPHMAQEIANAVREATAEQITNVMDIDAVNTVEEANLPTVKASPSTMKNTVLGGMLGIILSVGIFGVLYLLDDTIKTTDDVEKYLGLNTLASLPLKEGEAKGKKVRGKRKRR